MLPEAATPLSTREHVLLFNPRPHRGHSTRERIALFNPKARSALFKSPFSRILKLTTPQSCATMSSLSFYNLHTACMPARNALICNMASPGVLTAPLWDGFLSAASRKYDSVFLLSANDLRRVSPENILRISSAAEIDRFPALACQSLSQADIRKNGTSILAVLDRLFQPDIFFCGDINAIRLASRLTLWCRENANPSVWIALPSCPFNSVPFADFNAGFGSALATTSALASSLQDSCRRSARATPIGLLDISNDHYGWLTVGTAALTAGTGQVHCILPGTQFSNDELCKTLSRSLKKQNHVLLVMSSISGSQKESSPRLVTAAIEKTLGAGVRHVTCYPGDLAGPARVSKQDLKDCKAMGRAAVRLARKSRNSILVANHRVPGETHTLVFQPTALLEAVYTVRKVPDSFFRPKTFRTSAALSKLLACFL